MPENDSILQRQLTLSEMLDLPSFTSVCQGFAELFKVGVKVYEEKGAKLVDIKGGPGDFCAYVFEFPSGRSACIRAAARAKDGPVDARDGAAPVPSAPGMFSVACPAGCRYLIMPIRHEGDVVGRAVFGPFLPDDVRELSPAAAAAIGQGFDIGRARQLLTAMRRAPEAAIARVMGHFACVLDSLVFAGQKVLLTSQLHIEATRESARQVEAKNQELQQSNERLRELDRLKSNFLATVSHELRTPLTSIIGYSEMLVQGMAGTLTTEQGEYIRTILEKGESLLSLITSILDITQIEAGRLRLAFAPCDAVMVVRQAVSSIVPQAQRRGVKVELTAPETMRAPAIDREKVRQCVVNLLANALKFGKEQGTVKVQLSPWAPPGYLPDGVEGFTIAVEDDGIGIPAEQYGRIFETFYQIDQSSTRPYGGAGIGLAIVKSFVEAHGGRIGVESEVGRFSRFTIALPYERPMAGTEIDTPF